MDPFAKSAPRHRLRRAMISHFDNRENPIAPPLRGAGGFYATRKRHHVGACFFVPRLSRAEGYQLMNDQ
jgi:hypothetical protein